MINLDNVHNPLKNEGIEDIKSFALCNLCDFGITERDDGKVCGGCDHLVCNNCYTSYVRNFAKC